MITLFLLMFICFGCFGGYVHNDNIIDDHINQQQVKNVAFDVPTDFADDYRIYMNMNELATKETLYAIVEYATALKPNLDIYNDTYHFSTTTNLSFFGSYSLYYQNNFYVNSPVSDFISIGSQLNSIEVYLGSEGSYNNYVSRFVRLEIYTAWTLPDTPTFVYKYSYTTFEPSYDMPIITMINHYDSNPFVLMTFKNSNTSNYDNLLVSWASRGSNRAYQEGYDSGVENGKSIGEQIGFDKGVEYAESLNSTALTIFQGIVQVGLLPVNVFLDIFNFEVFGINISGMVSAMLSVAVILIVVRMIIGGKNDD